MYKKPGRPQKLNSKTSFVKTWNSLYLGPRNLIPNFLLLQLFRMVPSMSRFRTSWCSIFFSDNRPFPPSILLNPHSVHWGDDCLDKTSVAVLNFMCKNKNALITIRLQKEIHCNRLSIIQIYITFRRFQITASVRLLYKQQKV